MQWYATVLPRIHSFVPAEKILEIAPGYGRWTTQLKDLCKELIAVDLNHKCIDACRQRFADQPHVKLFANDGKSLDMVEEDSIDFAFSFDSLVHVDASVIASYLDQLAGKLTKTGIGFFHHSNAGEYRSYFSWTQGLPLVRRLLRPFGVNAGLHDRDLSMTARTFAACAETAGLTCIGQELVNWSTKRLLIDCFSVFTRQDSAWDRDNRVLRNRQFMHEARNVSRIATLYSADEAA